MNEPNKWDEWDMKNIPSAKELLSAATIVATIILVALFFSGCAFYGNQSQYEKGDWYLFTSSSEVAKMERNKQALRQKKATDQLAIEKLKAQPIDVQRAPDGTPLGYKGIVANVSRKKINTIIYGGPEEKAFFLYPGQEQEAALLPGNYTACSYIGGENKGCSSFIVSSQINYFNGRVVHWYTVYNPR